MFFFERPLSEPATLKKKFDDIFASTRYDWTCHVFLPPISNYIQNRYTKALDNIKSIRKDQLVQIKLDETTLSHIKEDKDKADQVNQSSSNLLQHLTNCELLTV